jgi:lysophospholipase L1-like esterase
MERQKAMIIIASLLLVFFLLYLLFANFNQSEQVSLTTQESTIREQVEGISIAVAEEEELESVTGEVVEEEEKEKLENTSDDPAAEEEAQLGRMTVEFAAEEEDTLETDSEKRTISEEIKKKIREVVEGTISLFKKDLKIVAIGDSLTQGVGDETENGGYVGILNHTFEDNRLNIGIENYGKRGNRTDQLLKRLEKKEIASSIGKADIVLVTIGANDIMKVAKNNFINMTIEPFEEERVEYIKRLTAIFNKINELNPDTQIYLIGFYNPFERHFSEIEELGMIMNNWNEAGKAVTEEFDNVHHIPTSDIFSNSDIELLADDYFHPNTSGYKLISKRVLESLNELSVETESSTSTVAP